MNHTKGPWKAEKARKTKLGWESNIRGAETEQSPNGDFLTSVFGDTEDECNANAKLVATAPDMLKALQDIVAFEKRCRDRGEPCISDHWLNQCIEAIEKAT